MSAEKFMTKEGIAEHLDRDIPLYIFDTIDSTNTYAKMLAAEGAEHGTTVIALQQTGGRGRLGRSFHAPPGTGIYMSIVLKTESDFSKALMATTAASVAVCRAVSAVCSAEAQIKWVNDIYLDGKKVCGILTEAITENGLPKALVVGIGINCSTIGFPEELLDIAGAIDGNYDPQQLTAQVINELLALAVNMDPREFIGEYKDRSMVIGKTVKVYKGGYSPDAHGLPARVLDIDNSGGLKVIYSSGLRETLSSGEISIRL
ncbi:MAG: biotin--[acetyl-CoA-carboxylase] ligase [Firmicutes bacterium]|nr:biotin--[acetyl-CoA-carboxylase] ligase [Bacillota bacterium]